MVSAVGAVWPLLPNRLASTSTGANGELAFLRVVATSFQPSTRCAYRKGTNIPLFRFSAPSEDELRRFISKQRDSVFSYQEVGASAGAIPSGYKVDRNRIQLGRGEDTWQRAVRAIREWRMFTMPWVKLHWPDAPIQVGTDVAVSIHHFGFYSLNACRIVCIVDEEESVNRFGFAYGTLAEHAESGEERFTVEWNRTDDTVWYDILAFSRPRQMLAKLGYPLSRLLQKRFAEASKAAMVKAARGR
jgi:uncharacterized protein (UPF0548 family)